MIFWHFIAALKYFDQIQNFISKVRQICRQLEDVKLTLNRRPRAETFAIHSPIQMLAYQIAV